MFLENTNKNKTYNKKIINFFDPFKRKREK